MSFFSRYFFQYKFGKDTGKLTETATISNANGTVLGDYANFNEPRTFGLEITTKF